MEQPYIILKEFFLHNDYPIDVHNYIMSLLVSTSNYNIHNSEGNCLLQTPDDQLHNWLFQLDKPYQSKLTKTKLPPVRKVIQIYHQTYALTHSNELYSLKSNETKMILPNVRDIVQLYNCIIATMINGTLWIVGSIHVRQKSPLSNVKNIFCTGLYDTIFAITESNELYSWESGSFCQPNKIILPDEIIIKDIEVLGKSIALTTNNELYDLKELKIILSNVRKVISNHNRFMAISLTNELYWWGCRNNPLPVNMKLSNIKDAFF